MKVLIVGAGGKGGPCASILAKQDEITEIRLADLDTAVTEAVAAHIDSPKIKTDKVNALDSDDVARAAAGADCVIDMVMPWMATYVMKGALKAKANYVNTAFDAPYWDEFLAGKKIEELTLYKEFREAGLTALLGCGMAPGFTNVIARLYAKKLDTVDSIKMRIGKAAIVPNEGKYDYMLRPWNPGWSPKQALVDCATPTYALEDGKFVLYPPFGGIEECDFPEPIGRLPVTHHSHEEIYSMPTTFEGLRECDFKYYIMPQPAMLYAMGLCSQDEVQVGDVKVKPIDVVAAMVPKPTNGLIGETAEKLAAADKMSFFEMIVQVSGIKDGKKTIYHVNLPKMNAPGPELLKIYGTSLVYVALPAAVGALQIMEIPKPGIIFADQLDPDLFIVIMRRTGYPYKWTETVY